MVKSRENPYEPPGKPGNAMCRFEFLEILVRLASEKYRGPGICGNFADSLEKLMDEHILVYY
jgi:hypothetical protein